MLGPIGENANLVSPGPGIVLRISSHSALERAHREVEIARWLHWSGVPVVRAFSDTPHVEDGRWVVTLWEYIPEVRPGSPATIGTVLRSLHRLAAPVHLSLPVLDPLAGIDGYIALSALGADEKAFLYTRLAELGVELSALDHAFPVGPVHGDAHRKNIVEDNQGRPVVLDLERFGIGAREWDLVVAAVYERVGWYTNAEYSAFADAYGWDVRSWAGFETLAAARELRMTAWLCARTGREPHLLPEARCRIASLKTPSAPKSWTPGT
ncbi:phosphotransferase enzyme family protein [Nocardiopsis sp. CC223A]|uniref:phosphotransferase enzyme family protein n=1 Tax=Nocardiopsis sp. CC223A TaxID=3044051 RepID=UPI00278BC006|nr:aminoglycoside phosphotransferase family protein [Nocardiopsis sp. CC223A]